MTPVRTLELPVSLRRRLLHLRGLCGAHVPAVVEAHAIEDAEKALRVKLGDPLLALFANGDDALGRLEIAVGKIVELTRDLRQHGGPRGLVAFGLNAERNTWLIANALGTSVGTYSEETGASAMRPLEAWLDDLIGAEKEALRELETEEKARTFKTLSDDEVAAFQPAIVSVERIVRRVRHPKFGVGEVLKEIDSGAKLEVLFTGEDKPRTLMASFLSVVD